MDLDEILEQYKALMIWHKYVKIIAAVLLAVMIGFIAWGIFSDFLKSILIISGAVFGIGGVVLYLAVHRLYIRTGSTVVDFLKAAGMSDSEIGALVREKSIELPGYSNK